jgi:endonuclease/exonuclease/phosphatase family metal-dependent hydrolase
MRNGIFPYNLIGLSILICHFSFSPVSAQLTFVELNCENLFDCRHDSLKQDMEFTPEGARHWTRTRYWQKLNHIGQAVLSCSGELPDLVALCEVENDTVLHDLTRRSLLRNAGYEYLMTESPDLRGIDVALLYQPVSFLPLCYEYIPVPLVKSMRPTRDILYVKGLTLLCDTLHLFVVHAPSRYGGERHSRPFRMQVAQTLCRSIRRLCHAHVIVAGDFNDYASSPALMELEEAGLVNVTKELRGRNGVGGNYRYRGEWHSLDHVLLSPVMRELVDTAYINDASFLLEDEPQYGGKRPHRSFSGYRYQHNGVSDHLPLVVRFRNPSQEKRGVSY